MIDLSPPDPPERDVVRCEYFARVGLQHEAQFIPTHTKISLINAPAVVRIPRIGARSYSHPAQMTAFSDASAVLAWITAHRGVHHKAMRPNLNAVARALVFRA